MMQGVRSYSLDVHALELAQIFRYALARGTEEDVRLLEECLRECEGKFSPQVWYAALPVKTQGALVDFGSFSVQSDSLAGVLSGCDTALVFCATVGFWPDRLVRRYGASSPVRALFCSAVGSCGAEWVCDTFVKEYETAHGVTLTERFSPGYGDLPLDTQRTLFSASLWKNCGVMLNESQIMSPSKSVTAFAGILKK